MQKNSTGNWPSQNSELVVQERLCLKVIRQRTMEVWGRQVLPPTPLSANPQSRRMCGLKRKSMLGPHSRLWTDGSTVQHGHQNFEGFRVNVKGSQGHASFCSAVLFCVFRLWPCIHPGGGSACPRHCLSFQDRPGAGSNSPHSQPGCAHLGQGRRLIPEANGEGGSCLCSFSAVVCPEEGGGVGDGERQRKVRSRGVGGGQPLCVLGEADGLCEAPACLPC